MTTQKITGWVLRLVIYLLMGSVLIWGRSAKGEAQHLSLTKPENPFLQQTILKESRSMIGTSLLDKLRFRKA